MADALLAYALMDEDAAIAYLQESKDLIESKQKVLRDMINGVTDEFEAFIHRQIVARSVTETLDGTGTADLPLQHHPIDSVTSLDFLNSDGSVHTSYDATDYWIIADEGKLTFRPGRAFTRATQRWAVTYVGGWATIPADLLLAGFQRLAGVWRSYEKDRDDIKQISVEGQTTVYDTGAIPARVVRVLKSYRLPVTA